MAEAIATLVAPAVPIDEVEASIGALGHEALELLAHEVPHVRLAGSTVFEKVRPGVGSSL